jgi:hypothetical protein
VKLARPLFPLVLLAAGLWSAWHFFFPPPEKVIQKRLQKLAAAISENPQGNIGKVANVNRIGSFFHPNVSLNVEGFGREFSTVQGRGELEQMAMGARQNGIGVEVLFSNIHVRAQRGDTNATAVVTAEVRLNGQKEPIVQDIRLGFEYLDRTWLIRSVNPLKTLKVE